MTSAERVTVKKAEKSMIARIKLEKLKEWMGASELKNKSQKKREPFMVKKSPRT